MARLFKAAFRFRSSSNQPSTSGSCPSTPKVTLSTFKKSSNGYGDKSCLVDYGMYPFTDKDLVKQTSKIILMTPVETHLFKFINNLNPADWFELFYQRIKEFRGAELRRDVLNEEFFDLAFDCRMIAMPKQKKNVKNVEEKEDMYPKLHFLGDHVRFCMRYNAVTLVKLGTTATNNQIPPFDLETYYQFPTNVVKYFGKNEKCLFLKIGRCSITGSGEIWFLLDSKENATEMHEKITEVFEMAAERRRSDGRKGSSQNLNIRLNNQGHRDRSHTNPIIVTSTGSFSNLETKEDRSKTWGDDGKAEERRISLISGIGSPKLNLNRGSISSNRNLSPVMAQNETGHLSQLDALKMEENKPVKKTSMAGLFQRLISNKEKDKDTLSNCDNKSLSNVSVDRLQIQEKALSAIRKDGSENDFISSDDINRYTPDSIRVKSPRPQLTPRQVSLSSTNSVQTTSSNRPTKSDYLLMDSNEAIIPPYTNYDTGVEYVLPEIKSYVSDSSSFSSIKYSNNALPKITEGVDLVLKSLKSADEAVTGPRAYSLGSKPKPITNQLASPKSETPPIPIQVSPDTMLNVDQLRKRAHSLGSGAWLKNQFFRRKHEQNCLTPNYSEEFALARSRANSNSINSKNTSKNTSIEKLGSDDHIEIDFSHGDSPKIRRLSNPSLENLSINSKPSRTSSLEIASMSTIQQAREIAVNKKIMAEKDAADKKVRQKNFLFLNVNALTDELIRVKITENGENGRINYKPVTFAQTTPRSPLFDEVYHDNTFHNTIYNQRKFTAIPEIDDSTTNTPSSMSRNSSHHAMFGSKKHTLSENSNDQMEEQQYTILDPKTLDIINKAKFEMKTSPTPSLPSSFKSGDGVLDYAAFSSPTKKSNMKLHMSSNFKSTPPTISYSGCEEVVDYTICSRPPVIQEIPSPEIVNAFVGS
uniref:IRS-type PTB domain-containing protein n=1 Tax=Rhabditophanes sp. KR3021 TaxID=114890 RepID=A0AC35TUQ8_9BILA